MGTMMMITMMMINLENNMMMMINIEKDDEKYVGEEEINLAVSMARAGTRLN